MKLSHPLRLLLILAAATPAAWAAAAPNCGGECGKDKPGCPAATAAVAATAATDAVKRHPLKGVITAVHADRSALMVKHEEIPGVMRAMTMLFKVDAATLKSAQQGQAITGLMSRQGSDWVLEDVKVVAARKN